VVFQKNIIFANKFISTPDNFKNFRLFLTDAAPYCMTAGRMLKNTFKNMKYMTCLAHAIHNFVETIRDLCLNTNRCIATITKKILGNLRS
jgi:hypothetical protein